MKITRRYGIAPAQRSCGTNNSCPDNSCPDVLGLDGDEFLVIGRTVRRSDIQDELDKHGIGVDPGESAVIIPGDVLRAAAKDITEEVG